MNCSFRHLERCPIQMLQYPKCIEKGLYCLNQAIWHYDVQCPCNWSARWTPQFVSAQALPPTRPWEQNESRDVQRLALRPGWLGEQRRLIPLSGYSHRVRIPASTEEIQSGSPSNQLTWCPQWECHLLVSTSCGTLRMGLHMPQVSPTTCRRKWADFPPPPPNTLIVHCTGIGHARMWQMEI